MCSDRGGTPAAIQRTERSNTAVSLTVATGSRNRIFLFERALCAQDEEEAYYRRSDGRMYTARLGALTWIDRQNATKSMTDDTQVPVPLDAIVDNGLCTGCGMCVGMGRGLIKMRMTGDGYERPFAEASLGSAAERFVNSICPGIGIDGANIPQTSDGARVDVLWGPARAMCLARAVDPELRFIGSSGGVLGALALHMLETKDVDFVLHVAADEVRPLRNRAHVSRSREDVIKAAGSRYAPAAPLVCFEEALEAKRPFAVIAKPCDICALTKLAHYDDRVERYVRYRLAMFCGGVSALGKSLEPLEPHGLDENQITLYRYRGHGNPGLTHVETVDGRTFDYRYLDLWEEGPQRLQFRCRICPDAIGLQADLVVHDVWPDGPPKDDLPDLNGVIARTPRGRSLLDDAVAAKSVEVTSEHNFEAVARYQPHQADRRRAIAPRLAAMRDAGALCPRFVGLQLDEAAGQLTQAERSDEYRGMAERLARGVHHERP